MRGIYVSTYDLNNKSSGVSKKINAQVSSLEQKGVKMNVFDSNSISVSENGKVRIRLDAICGTYRGKIHALLSAIIKKINAGERYDFVYIRKGLIDKEYVHQLCTIKRSSPNTKILLEIPTYPYDGEIPFYDYPFLHNDRLARKDLSYCVDRIVTYSEDEEIFGVPTIQIHNGADYTNTPVRSCKKHEGINLIAVALFDSWHGYDRVIRGMKMDFYKVMDNNLHLWLVGNGRAVRTYKKLVNRYRLSDYVHFCGLKSGAELTEIYDSSDIGLDAMGRHRGGVYYNSTLKGKEYCARGIPSISGVRTELDAEPGFPYYLRVPADDSPVSVDDILAFYHKIYDDKNPETVAQHIREITIEKFSIENVFNPVKQYLDET